MRYKYETIIWDWNGTLLDDVDLAIGVMNDLLEEYGYPRISRARYTHLFDFPVQCYYERIGFDLRTHDFKALSDRFCATFEERIHEASLFDDVHGTISALDSLRHFVLSNTEQDRLHRMLARFDLAESFAAAHGLHHNLASGKTGIGEDLLESNGVNRETAVMVGDTTHDAEVAQTLNVDCILVSTGHNSHQRLATTGAPVVDSLEQLTESIVIA